MKNLFIPALAVSMLIGACKKKKDDPSPEPTSTSSPTEKKTDTLQTTSRKPSVEAILDGNRIRVSKDSVFSWGNASISITETYYIMLSSIGINDSMDLQLGQGYNHTDGFFHEGPSDKEKRAFFTLGDHAYSIQKEKRGAFVKLMNVHKGTEYSTEYGPQDGSTWTIVKATEIPQESGLAYLATIQFSGKVYRTDGTLYKTITQGVFEGYFE